MKGLSIITGILASMTAVSCSIQKRLASEIISEALSETAAGGINVTLEKMAGYDVPEYVKDEGNYSLVETEECDGKEKEEDKSFSILETRKDSSGNNVASVDLEPLVINGDYRNVVERGGTINLKFAVNIPQELMNEYWELRLTPVIYCGNDTIMLETSSTCGKKFIEDINRKRDLLERILSEMMPANTDSSLYFTYRRLLESFLARNLGEDFDKYCKSGDVVCDSSAYRLYKNAVAYYCRNHRIRKNDRLKRKSEELARELSEKDITGNRPDTVMLQENTGNIIIRSTSEVSAKTGGQKHVLYSCLMRAMGFRKIELSVMGDILDIDGKTHKLPPAESLTYYISTLASFADTSSYLSGAVNMPAKDFEEGTSALISGDYRKALNMLGDRGGINSAIAYISLDYNAKALEILGRLPKSADRDYLTAIALVRNGNRKDACKYLQEAIRQDESLAFRANLDPEISNLSDYPN